MSRTTDREVRSALAEAAMMLLGMGGAVATSSPRVFAVAGALTLAWWVWRDREARLGLANAVTALRVLLAASIAWLVPDALVPWGGVMVLLIFTLDGLDGWWARRTRTDSRFGAAFDQEADAFMVAIVSIALVEVGLAPPWVLVVGALRYGYVLVVWTLQTHGEAPRSAIARHAFGIVVVSFVAVMVWPTELTRGAMRLASMLIVASFARSLWWSWRGPVRGG